MPTVIDSLIVTLGLDAKDVDSKAPGVRKKLSDMEKAGSDTEKSFKNLTASLGSFLAVLGGTAAISSFVKDTISANTQLYFLSRNLEMSTQKLYAWGAAAQEIGGNKGTIQGFAKTIAEMPGQLLIGRMPQLLPLFARLGISFREPFDQIMLDLSKRFASMDRKTAFSFGIASGIPEDVLNLLLQGPGAVGKAIGRGTGFGPTQQEAASAANLKRGFVDLELQLTKIGYDLLYKVTPLLERFLGVLQAIGAWAQRHERLVALIAGIAAALGGVVSLSAGIIGFSFAWSALVSALASAWPVLAVVGIVTALGAAILLLWDDYKVWAEGGKSEFDWSGWVGMIQAAKHAWDDLTNAIKSAWDWVGKWYDRAAHALGLDTSAKTQSAVEKKSIEAYNKAHPGHQIGDAETRRRAQLIAQKEGFYAAGNNIPKSAHNPGDILYGKFALEHGATGYKLAQGGKKVAVFPDDATGFAAMYALLGSKSYAGLSDEQAVLRWQTGKTSPASTLLNGIPSASSISSSLSASSATSNSNTDNSKTTNIGTVNIQSPAGSSPMTPSMVRGMDWTTLLTQQNFGLQ